MLYPQIIDRRLLLYWPLVFALTVSTLRWAILLTFGTRSFDSTVVAGFILGLPAQIAFGLLLAIPLHLLRRSRARWSVHVLTLLVVAANAAAFHYEAVFGRLPGAGVLYYVSEMRHLVSSAAANAPLLILVLEVIAATALLVVAAERLPRDGMPRRRLAAAIAVAISIAVAILLHVAPRVLPPAYLWSSRAPLIWVLQSWMLRGAAQAKDSSASSRATQVREWQRQLGHRTPFGGVDERYPLCGPGPREPGREGNGRSVIFVILESVGLPEMSLHHGKQAVMPHLQRIAAENILFRNLKATGNKSVQALPALLAGIPPQPASNLLWQAPLKRVEGFARVLKRRGYRTAYFHGGDLSFEQQRPFIRMAGFDEIIEFDLAGGHPFLGWGWSDDIVFAKLRKWIDRHRSERASEPYLATLFTLSTHDPYVLPADRKRVFGIDGARGDLIETLHFADEQLGAFYEWYLEHEAAKGTVLVITGDHRPLLGAGGSSVSDPTRFDVPLIVARPQHQSHRAARRGRTKRRPLRRPGHDSRAPRYLSRSVRSGARPPDVRGRVAGGARRLCSRRRRSRGVHGLVPRRASAPEPCHRDLEGLDCGRFRPTGAREARRGAIPPDAGDERRPDRPRRFCAAFRGRRSATPATPARGAADVRCPRRAEPG